MNRGRVEAVATTLRHFLRQYEGEGSALFDLWGKKSAEGSQYSPPGSAVCLVVDSRPLLRELYEDVLCTWLKLQIAWFSYVAKCVLFSDVEAYIWGQIL